MGGSPVYNTSVYNRSNASKNSSGTCFENSAVDPTASPFLSVFYRRILIFNSWMVQKGAENSAGGSGTSHGPFWTFSNMQAKKMRTNDIKAANTSGQKCCMPFQLPRNGRKRNNCLDFHWRKFFCAKFGFPKPVPFAIVDPVFFSVVTAST